MEREPVPHETVSIGETLIPLPWDNTELYYFTDPAFQSMCHIYTVHPEDPERRVILFGIDEDGLDYLQHLGYRSVYEEKPPDNEVEMYVQWELSGLDKEWEDEDGI